MRQQRLSTGKQQEPTASCSSAVGPEEKFDNYEVFTLRCSTPLATLQSQKVRERHTDEAGNGPHCALRKEIVREYYIVSFNQRIRPLLATTDLLSSSVATSLTEIGTQTFLSSLKHSYRNAKVPSRGVFRKGYHSQKGIGVSKFLLSGPFKMLAKEAGRLHQTSRSTTDSDLCRIPQFNLMSSQSTTYLF